MSISEKASADSIVEELPRSDADASYTKRIVRKIDLHILPILGIIYCISLVDRVNIANAYVSGMADDLELRVGTRYSLAVLIFFLPYVIFELPSNILVRRVGAARWLGTIVTCWGILMIGMGFLTEWWHLVICRVLLGLLEAGSFPTCVYIISTWYLRREVQTRLTAFYSICGIIAAFSSTIAGLISRMAGTQGLNGWQWIFIFYGLITVVVGILGLLLVQDFPDKNKFLTSEETTFVLDRINKDRSDAESDPWTWAKFWTYVFDIHLWSFAVIFGAGCVIGYVFSYFLPIILVQGMGYSSFNAQLLSTPPAIVSAFTSLGMAILSDRWGVRAPFIVFMCVVSLTGLSLTAFHSNNAVRYFGVFLGLTGQSTVPACLGYLQNNVCGHTKRAYATALVAGGGGVGGVIASLTFRVQDAPRYRLGLWVSIGSMLLIIVVVAMNSTYYYFKNKAVREGRAPPIEGRPGFYYTY